MMKKRRILILPLFLLFIFVLVLAAGCTTPVEKSGNPGENASGPVEKVEIYHFHRTSQCYSCKTVGAYAEETVNTYFAPELASGKVVFGHINTELPENKALAEHYGLPEHRSGSEYTTRLDFIRRRMSTSGIRSETRTNTWHI